MTESAAHRESLPLDSTAQLLTRITTQLGTQLRHVSLNGTRRPMTPPTHPLTHPPRPPSPPALVAVAHGSRDPMALRTVTTLLERVRELRPGLDVRLGHIELNEPLLPDTLADIGPGAAVLVPLLLSRGYHVKQDLPQAAATAPHLRIRIASPLGPHPLLVEALYARLTEAGWQTSDATHRGSGVVLAAAGSRDPQSAADTRRTAAMLSERLGGVPVVPAYASAASPAVPEALRALAARGRHRTAVASYFTAPGRFAAQSAAAAPWIASAPLGTHPALARLLLLRYDQALATRSPLPRRQLASA
ncbi:sirohydrochlorin chelatase [Streptomyces sp. ISL-99]|uniref:sirohydrochlorin chelatase n=1 Tax=Streptomyces sp. ISL-99 TaxID=2819193 RepID=UPI001BE74961|nr:CbiX/SirB N-terminal domain-containing protein [Streptomyces sp. ISL-99]MBT2527007.1 sirohydrochlorin chelatase [Streptomyces sp. ISL-99]